MNDQLRPWPHSRTAGDVLLQVAALAATVARYGHYGHVTVAAAQGVRAVDVDSDCPLRDLREKVRAAGWTARGDRPAASIGPAGARGHGAVLVELDPSAEGYRLRPGSRAGGSIAEAHLAEVFEHFLVALDVPDPGADRTVSSLEVLGEATSGSELTAGRGDRVEVDGEQVHQTVARIAAEDPDRTAIVDGPRSVTYGQLARQVLAVADLIRSRGVDAGQAVAVSLDRGVASAGAQLGAFAAGCPVVLLDPATPQDRLRFMLADAQVRLLFTAPAHAEPVAAAGTAGLPWTEVPPAADHFPATADLVRQPDEAVSHIAYTSGSTGEPKAVLLRHGPMLNTARALAAACGLRPDSRGSWTCALGVGMVEVDLFPTLSAGGTVVVAPAGIAADARAMVAWLTENAVTHTLQPTALAEQMLTCPWPEQHSVQSLRAAGERQRSWPPEHIGFQVLNVYGSTEANVVAACDLTALAACRDARTAQSPPIGRAVDNVNVYVLDDRLRPVPRAAVGELFVSGRSLSRGYLNRAEAQSARFLPNRLPGDPYPVLYRTGDLARFDERGQLEVLGRADDEVKVSGYRVHPGDVEAALSAIDGVAACAVIARQRAETGAQLVAFVQPSSGHELTAGDLRRQLARWLPPHMIPSLFLFGALPVSANGKLDRSALAQRTDLDAPAGAPAPTAPGVEQQIADLFAEVLGVPAVDVDAHFFELGGGSIQAATLGHLLQERLGLQVALADLLSTPTPRAIGALPAG